MTREGLSALGGVIGLAIVFATMTWVAVRAAGNTELLIALAATLPRQIEMTENVHLIASGWNDVLAFWTRIGGIVDNMVPPVDPNFDDRIKFDRLLLRQGDDARACASVEEALGLVLSEPTGRVQVRGGNGSGKSTLLAALREQIKTRAYYWPTTDRLAFKFASAAGLDEPEDTDLDEEEMEERDSAPAMRKLPGFSSGERQLKSLQEIVANTAAAIYLLDEWDANLDPSNRAAADALVEQLSQRARVVEISHRDRV
jgi:ABC-type iron transport system FetAB ATPase subunit